MNTNNINIRSYLDYISTFSSTRGRNDILKPVTRNYPVESNYSTGQGRKRDSAEGGPAQGKSERGANAAGVFTPERTVGGSAGTESEGRAGGTGIPAGKDQAETSAGTTIKQAPGTVKNKSGSSGSGFSLDFSGNSLLNGIILSEVLGKPKYLRKGRW